MLIGRHGNRWLIRVRRQHLSIVLQTRAVFTKQLCVCRQIAAVPLCALNGRIRRMHVRWGQCRVRRTVRWHICSCLLRQHERWRLRECLFRWRLAKAHWHTHYHALHADRCANQRRAEAEPHLDLELVSDAHMRTLIIWQELRCVVLEGHEAMTRHKWQTKRQAHTLPAQSQATTVFPVKHIRRFRVLSRIPSTSSSCVESRAMRAVVGR